MNDAELQTCFNRMRQQDMTAFEELYQEMKTPVFTVLLRITQDKWMAEDLFQELFTGLYLKPPSSSITKPRAYLFRAAHNLAIDCLRKQRQTISMEENTLASDHTPDSHAVLLDLESALGKLAVAERQVVILHLNGGLKFREIANIVQEPLGTVYARYRQSIEKLRTMLDGGALI